VRERALVVRSGENAFSFASKDSSVEIVERISHSIVPLREGIDRVGRTADLAIFTSQIAVRRLVEEQELFVRFQSSVARIAAVGRATAAALERVGLTPTLVASGSAESVLEQLPPRLQGQRILLPRGQDASEELPAGLARRGADVVPIVLYRKVLRPRDEDFDREILERPFGAFCATSPGAARWLFRGIDSGPLDRLRATPAVALGRFTARFLASHGVARVEIAPQASFAAAAQLLVMLAKST
jgi:uroporphyrinogen-III synthase